VCIPARFVDEETARAITSQFLNTNFEGGRHQRRVDKIDYAK
jgi:ribose 5-phosphate isomerase B